MLAAKLRLTNVSMINGKIRHVSVAPPGDTSACLPRQCSACRTPYVSIRTSVIFAWYVHENMSKRGREPDSFYDLVWRRAVYAKKRIPATHWIVNYPTLTPTLTLTRTLTFDTLREIVHCGALTFEKVLEDLLFLSGRRRQPRLTYRRRINVSWRVQNDVIRERDWAGPRARYRDGSIGNHGSIAIQPWGPHEYGVPQMYYRGGRGWPNP